MVAEQAQSRRPGAGHRVLCGGLGWLSATTARYPIPTRTDIGFLQDMRTHHEQAVTMSLVLPRPSRAPIPTFRLIAREIVFDQGIDIGRMIQLLRQFGEPPRPTRATPR